MRQRHIVIMNRYFYPDISSVPQLLTDLAVDLIRDDFKVSVLCSRNSYDGSRKRARYEQYKGIDIYRVKNFSGRNKGKIARLLEALTYFPMVFLKGLFIGKADVVVALSSPPMAAFISIRIARLKRARSIYVVEDLHPQLAEALGYIKKKSLLYKAAWLLNRHVLKKADRIVVLGKHMRAKVIENFKDAAGKVVEIPNWADGRHIVPMDKNKNPMLNQWVKEKGLENLFTVQYSGNMGLAHNFETILDAINLLKNRRQIRFVFIGDGPGKKEITTAVQKRRLTNLDIYPYQAYEKLGFSLNACDIALVSMRTELDGLLVPCKIYGILAAGKPFILVGGQENEIADITRTHGIGRVVQEGNVEGLIDAVLFYKNNPQRARQEGNLARQVFESHFQRRHSVSKYIQTINSMYKMEHS